MKLTERDKLRFWEKVTKQDGCWPWKWLRSSRLGEKRAHFSAQGTTHPSARVMWFLTNGPIPDGLYVLHTCDNGDCVNPEHLFLGTAQDNILDCIKKGRKSNKPKWMRTPKIIKEFS